jgi:hypothetical protein
VPAGQLDKHCYTKSSKRRETSIPLIPDCNSHPDCAEGTTGSVHPQPAAEHLPCGCRCGCGGKEGFGGSRLSPLGPLTRVGHALVQTSHHPEGVVPNDQRREIHLDTRTDMFRWCGSTIGISARRLQIANDTTGEGEDALKSALVHTTDPMSLGRKCGRTVTAGNRAAIHRDSTCQSRAPLFLIHPLMALWHHYSAPSAGKQARSLYAPPECQVPADLESKDHMVGGVRIHEVVRVQLVAGAMRQLEPVEPHHGQGGHGIHLLHQFG